MLKSIASDAVLLCAEAIHPTSVPPEPPDLKTRPLTLSLNIHISRAMPIKALFVTKYIGNLINFCDDVTSVGRDDP